MLRDSTSFSSALLAIVVLAGATVFSQLAECDNFLETMGGGEIWSVAASSSGLAAAGRSGLTGPEAACVAQMNSAGGILLQTAFRPANSRALSAAVATADGGHLLSFNVDFFDGHGMVYAVWLVKIDSAGSVQWHRTFGDSTHLYWQGMPTQCSSGYALLAKTQDYSTGVYSTQLIRLDSAGHDLWAKKYLTGWIDASRIIETSDGGFFAVLSDWADFLIWRLKGDGTFVWQTDYIAPGRRWDLFLGAMRETSDHGLVIAAASRYEYGTKDVLIMRLKSDGTLDWSYSYDVDGHNDWADDVLQTADGGYAVVGTVRENDAFFMKVDSSGAILWQKQYMDYTSLKAVAKKTDGGYLLGGYFQATPSYRESLLVSTDSSGEVGAECTYYGPCHLGRYSFTLVRSITSYAVESLGATSTTIGWSSASGAWDENWLCAPPSPPPPAPGPTITKIKSRTSKPGKPATILGSGFATDALDSGTSADSNKVYFGRYLAEQTRPPTESRLKVKIPKKLRPGKTYLVKVITNGKESNKVPFEVK